MILCEVIALPSLMLCPGMSRSEAITLQARDPNITWYFVHIHKAIAWLPGSCTANASGKSSRNPRWENASTKGNQGSRWASPNLASLTATACLKIQTTISQKRRISRMESDIQNVLNPGNELANSERPKLNGSELPKRSCEMAKPTTLSSKSIPTCPNSLLI